MTSDQRRGLYPEIDAHVLGWMETESVHEIYYEESGSAAGKPVVVLHGGPGGATNPGLRRFFDPKRWRTVMFDQRGCGRSRPHADLSDNTTWTLIEDIERLRVRLGIEKWTVFGGSWGSTLALAYAIKHPERVEALILRGIFLMTKRELHWFYQDGASALFPDVWERFLEPIPAAERGDLMGAYYKRLTSDDIVEQTRAAVAWTAWEGDTISIGGPAARPQKFDDIAFAVAFARLECWYFINGGFLPEDGWLLKNIDALRHIPCWIVQGRFDVCTPIQTAWALHRAWPEARFEIIGDAGHAATEPGTVDALVRATDAAVASPSR
jgi:proline iminopeptidase